METNERMTAALELMRFKALIDISEGRRPVLQEQDINEILTVAGMPVVVPGEIGKKELEVI